MFQLIYCLHSFKAHEFYRILVTQIVTAFDRVKGVPFGMVFFIIAQGRAYPALCRPGVRAGGVELTEHSGISSFRCVQSRHQSRSASADHYDIKLVLFH